MLLYAQNLTGQNNTRRAVPIAPKSSIRYRGHPTFLFNKSRMSSRQVGLRNRQVNANKTDAGFNVPGISKVLNPNASKPVRLFWGVVVGCCAATCFHQLSERVGTYFNFATTLDMLVVRNQTITFPAITICPALKSSIVGVIIALTRFINTACANNPNLRCPNRNESIFRYDYNLTDLNITEDVLWPYFTIQQDLVTAAVPSDNFGGSENLIPFEATYSNITTYWGLCLVVTPAKPLEYRGPYTYIRIEIKKAGVMFFLHNKDIEQRHDAYFLAEPLNEERFSDIRLGTKQFNFLNTSRDPCMDEADVVNCRNNCIDKMMDKTLNCSMKFMINSKLKPCKTLQELVRTHGRAQATYAALKSGQCSCMRKCRETLFSVTTDVSKHLNKSETHFDLYYPDNLHEIVQESYAYSLSALLSDIGGTLGFYLGFCVVTVIELIEELFRKSALALKKKDRIPVTFNNSDAQPVKT